MGALGDVVEDDRRAGQVDHLASSNWVPLSIPRPRIYRDRVDTLMPTQVIWIPPVQDDKPGRVSVEDRTTWRAQESLFLKTSGGR